MAAILCQTIGELCSKTCECMKLPCSYVGQACSRSCEIVGEVLCTPFAPYLIVTLGLNTPAVVYAFKSIGDYDCSGSLFRWLVINAIFGLCHMVAAFYITDIIRKPAGYYNETTATPTINATTGLNSPKAAEEGKSTSYVEATPVTNFTPIDNDNMPGGANSFQRIKHVFCYDKGMAIYIVIFLSWIVWMGIGVGRRLGAANCDSMTGYMSTTIVCGYIWMSLVGTAFCCSLLCLR